MANPGFWRKLRPRLLLLGLFSISPQLPAQPAPGAGSFEVERFPASGVVATLVGERIILYPDGSARPEAPRPDQNQLREEHALTEAGQLVVISRTVDPDTGETRSSWKYSDQQVGLIQILISRGITTLPRDDATPLPSCIATIEVRNLASMSLFRLVAEITFHRNAERVGATSVMMGPLAFGATQEVMSSPVYGASCNELRATLSVPYCQLQNGWDCKAAAAGSEFGMVPLHRADLEETSQP